MSFWLDCKNPYLDFVSRIDGAGRVLEKIPVFDALAASPYAPILHTTDPCDPTTSTPFTRSESERAAYRAPIPATSWSPSGICTRSAFWTVSAGG